MDVMDVLDHASSILQAFDIEPKPLDRIVEGHLRRHRDVSSAWRRCIAEAVFGVMRWRGRIDGWLRMQGIARPNHCMRLLCFLLWKRPEAAAIVPYEELARAAGIAGEMPEEMPRDFPGGEAAFVSFPDFLHRMLVQAHGVTGARELAMKLNEPARPILRANTLKATVEDARRALSAEGIETEQTGRSPFGFSLARRASIEATRAYREGQIEIQDEASQLSVLAAAPKPGARVLDACAGAGGKSLMMAMLMRNAGRIVAADPVASKRAELSRRARRSGARIIDIVSTKDVSSDLNLCGEFDLVFIDAPCSGTGTLRRSPDLKWRLSPEMITSRIQVQRDLLKTYASYARPGGRIAYATCSVLPCENEEVVRDIAQDLGLRVVNAAEELSSSGVPAEDIVTPEGFLKLDPRTGEWDGFFIAIIAKT